MDTAKVTTDVNYTINSTSHCQDLKKAKTTQRRHFRHWRRIRRLVNDAIDPTETTIENVESNFNSKFTIFIISLLVTSCIITCIISMSMDFSENSISTYLNELSETFLTKYQKQYMQIIYGQIDYCDRPMNLTNFISGIINRKVLHQDEALKQLQLALNSGSTTKSIAFVGPSGVGKSLVMRTLVDNFPWPDNVHIYVWNTNVREESEKFHMLRLKVDKLSKCGFNLLIVENLRTCDYGIVSIINNHISETIGNQKQVFVIYIFNINTMLEKKQIDEQRNILHTLNNTEIINFKQFTSTEIRDCIRREGELENLVINDDDFEEIVETVDAFRSGCKNVLAKVRMYGTIKSKTQ